MNWWRQFDRGLSSSAVLFSVVLFAACGTSGTASPTTSAASALSSISALVVSPPGFTSEKTDAVGGGQTGSIGIDEAESADCDSGQVRQDHWVASELRHYDNDPSYPQTYLLLCVTQLGSPTDASSNQAQVVGAIEHPPAALPAPVTFPVSDIPGAVGDFVGGGHAIAQIFFSKGPYYVFVVGTGLSPTGAAAAQTLANRLAATQYQDLPQ
jgi:hypothetical protein